jgi:hypothetical protein
MPRSMKSLDRVFAALLLVGSVLHCYGSLATYGLGTAELVWALSGSLAGGLIAAINLLRAGRPADTALAWLACVASLGWLAVALGYGSAIGNIADPRVLWHAIAALGLTAFSVRTALGRQSTAPAS